MQEVEYSKNHMAKIVFSAFLSARDFFHQASRSRSLPERAETPLKIPNAHGAARLQQMEDKRLRFYSSRRSGKPFIPGKAGIQSVIDRYTRHHHWIPAFAGMTRYWDQQ